MAQLPILHSEQPKYDWVTRLAAMREAYDAAVAADPGRAARDRAALDADLAYHSLRLKGVEVTREQVAAAAAGSFSVGSVEAAAAGVLAAIGRVRAAADANEDLTPQLMLEVNRLVDPERGGVLREGPPVAAYPGHQAPAAAALPTLVENLAEWFGAPSFTGEFHPVEQAALALIRVCDIQPFPSNNELTARIAVSLFTLRRGWPPVVVRDELEGAYRTAIQHAMHLDTGPVVELIAACVARAYDDLMAWGIHAALDEGG